MSEGNGSGNGVEEVFSGPVFQPSETVQLPETAPGFSPLPERAENTRRQIAFILVFGLIALFLASFLFAGTVDEAIKLIQAISSALTGLVGAVLGYYFGQQKSETKESAG